MPDLLFETHCQALASFMKCNTLSSAYEQTCIYSDLQQKTNSPLSVEYLGPLGNQSVTRTSGIKENIYSFYTVHLSSFR